MMLCFVFCGMMLCDLIFMEGCGMGHSVETFI